MDRFSVLAWISTMTDKQFVEFFYEAVAGRDTSEVEGQRGHLVLAETGMYPGEERDTFFIALPDLSHYSGGWADDSPICQGGDCVECGSQVRSIAKNAICPICEAKVYCS